jgi:hypothetical protein
MTTPQPNGTSFTFAQSPRAPPPAPDSVHAAIVIANAEWQLLVKPAAGWVPAWRGPLVVLAVIGAALFGLLVGAVLVSRKQQQWLLKEMKVGGWVWGGGGRFAPDHKMLHLSLAHPSHSLSRPRACHSLSSRHPLSLPTPNPTTTNPPPFPQATNTALASEKQRMDVLLARQYNLISCVLESGAVGGAAGDAGRSVQEKTLGEGRGRGGWVGVGMVD